jgi:hypothetical protein
VLALSLVVAIVLYFWFVGMALFALLGKDIPDRTLAVHVAPVLGATVLVVPAIALSRAGLPVREFGPSLVVVTALAAAFVWWRERPAVPRSHTIGLALVVLLNLALFATPFLVFGFNWVAVSNDDMTNYALSAERFLRYGYFQLPGPSAIARVSSVDLAYYFLTAVDGERVGVDVLLSVLLSLTGLAGIKAFMTLAVAGNIALVCAAGALVPEVSGARLRLIASLLAALSPLVFLGVMLQLLGQIYGLGSLCAAVAIFTAVCAKRYDLRAAVLFALASSGLVADYPELAPLALLAVTSYAGVALLRKRASAAVTAAILGTGLAATALLLGPQLRLMLVLLESRYVALTGKHSLPGASPFPYFLVPSGLANLWGLLPVSQLWNEPWSSFAILCGGILALAGLAYALAGTWRMRPAAVLLLASLPLAVSLAHDRNGFGLFKLAMYVAPFLGAALLFSHKDLQARPRAILVSALALVALQAPTLIWYASTGSDLRRPSSSAFIEVPQASRLGMYDRLEPYDRATQREFVSDTFLAPLAKYEAGTLRRHELTFPSTDEFHMYARATAYHFWPIPADPMSTRDASLAAAHLDRLRPERICVPERTGCLPDAFVAMPRATSGSANAALLLGGPLLSILNRSSFGAGDALALEPEERAAPALFFVGSSLGSGIDAPKTLASVAIGTLEPDYFFPDATMAGINRYMLFEVLPRVKAVRLEFELTNTLASDGVNALPPARVFGDGSVAVPFTGRGAGRVVTPLVRPALIDGRAYVGVDMGRDGRTFPVPRRGLMRLFGTGVLLDYRRIVAFGRNISVSPPIERASVPTQVVAFPAGLRDRNLLFSGVYEDGWISENAFFDLRSLQSTTRFTLDGVVPQIGDRTDFETIVTISIDGSLVLRKLLYAGAFSLDAPVKLRHGVHEVRVRFSKTQALPGADRRPAAARVDRLGFADDF